MRVVDRQTVKLCRQRAPHSLLTAAGYFSYLFGDYNYTGQCSFGEPWYWCLRFVNSAQRPSLTLYSYKSLCFPQATIESAARSKVCLPLNKGAAIPKVQSNLKYQISNEPWPLSCSSLCTWLNPFLPAGPQSPPSVGNSVSSCCR